jgi:arylsulfatase A-like enzyme
MQKIPRILPCLILLVTSSVLVAAPGDTDDDGLRDEVETGTGVLVSPENTGTNPHLADSDGDSMPDGLELNLGTNPTISASKVKRPNIIYILADDLGYGDIGCFWQNQRTGIWKFATPKLDTMAAEGAMLTHHYVGAPICVSSRSSFLQGRSQGHADIRDFQFDFPLPNGPNIASILQGAGYRTIHIGKAGLTGKDPNNPQAHPLDRGFDRFFGYLTHSHAHEHYPRNGLGLHGAKICDDRSFITDAYQDLFSADAFTAFAKKEIIEQQQLRPNQPFFMYLSFDTPHFVAQTPPTKSYPPGMGLGGGLQWTGSPSYVNTAVNDPARIDNLANVHESVHPNWNNNEVKKWVSMVRRMDDSVADILQTLRDLGVADNTLVVFTTDNGPEINPVDPRAFESYGPFEGTKGDFWEGGIRVPTIAWWPGTLSGSNQLANIRRIARPCANYDWLATFAEMAGVPSPSASTGVSMLPSLTGSGIQKEKGYLHFEMLMYGQTYDTPAFPNHRGEARQQMQAIRIGDFMGVRTNMATADDPFRIYDVVNDLKQAINLAPGRPDLQQQMKYHALAGRRKGPSAMNVLEATTIPAITPRGGKPGIAWKAYEGYWSWLPEFRELVPVASGMASDLSPALRSRDKDAGLAFEGYLSVPTTGAYTFQTVSDASTSLWLHDSQVIDNDFSFTPTKTSGLIDLAAGLHPIRLYYRHRSGPASLELKYSGPGISLQKIPSSVLFTDGQPTILQPDRITTMASQTVEVDVLANDSAENPLLLESVSPPQGGISSVSNGKVIYTATAGFLGKDPFTYTVNDGLRAVSSMVQANVLFDDEIWFPLDEDEGTDVEVIGSTFVSKGTLTGTADPAAAWVPGRRGKALIFDGAEMQVDFLDLSLPSGNSPRTFSCWLKTGNTSLAESQTLFTYGQATGSGRFTVRLDRGPGSPSALVAAVEALPGRIIGTKILNDGLWHHLAVVLSDKDLNGSADISEVMIFIDGQPDTPSSLSPGHPATSAGTGAILGGRDDTETGNFKGTLDDVRLFARALAAGEVTTLYQAMPAHVIFDSDGDGWSDLHEEVAGTNPGDPSSFVKLGIIHLQEGTLVLRWEGVAGRTYTIEESNDMAKWAPVVALAPLTVNKSLPNATVTLPSNGSPRRFFRLAVSLTPPPGPDTDRDGFPDAAEVMAGTDPNDPSSFFRIDATTHSESALRLQWHGRAGRQYRVEESTNLFQWMRVPNLAAVETAADTPAASIQVPSNGAPRRFLRIGVEIMSP